MPHLFYYLDFTVSVFVVRGEEVLLVDHKQLGKWLPLGGHIEPGENPEQAAYREVAEESSLEVKLIGDKPPDFAGMKPLVAPAYLDVHNIQGEHSHLGMIYFAAAEEHDDIQWFSAKELEESSLEIPEAVRFCGLEAIRRLTGKRS